MIADVTVTQTYRNDGDRTISARYVFPASTRAAVYGMKMKIGDARHRREDQGAARKRAAEYEEAKAAGKTASLLEEDRPNVFSMSVANILPKDRIDVELHYTELLVPTDGVYELVYPTVVGPRYASEARRREQGDNQFMATPYTHAGAAPTYGVRHQRLRSPPAWRSRTLDSPSHTIDDRVRRRSRRRDGRARPRATRARQQGLRACATASPATASQLGPAAVPGREGELLPDDGAAAAPPGARR